ncbi:MAG: tetratricopeptide repeat protein [Chthoniobacterales bacterium]
MKTAVASLLFLTSALLAEDAPLFQAAEAALREGIPQVGIQKLQSYLTQNLSAEQTRRVNLELAQAYLSIKKTDAARELLARISSGEDVNYWLAQSYLTDRNWHAVIQKLDTLPSTDSAFYARDVFARAEAKRGLGQLKSASEDYELIEADPMLGDAARLRKADISLQTTPSVSVKLSASKYLSPAATLLTAQSFLLTKDYPNAERHFRSLLDNPAGLASSQYATIHLGLARALAEQNHLDDAGDLLEKFIEERPCQEQLPEIFVELNTIYQKQSNPSQNPLRHWSRDATNPARQALAIYYQSQFDLRDKGSDTALATLSSWLDKFPTHPLRASVLLKYGEQLISENKLQESVRRLNEGLALSSLPTTTGELHATLARALFANNHFAQAASHFQKASELLNNSAQNLLYNSALCWLRDSNFKEFLTAYQNFSSLFPESNLRRDLLMEEGFFQARTHEMEKAQSTLNLFIRDFPEHPRIPDAHLALAEISTQSAPAEAEQQLVLVSQSHPAPETAERAAYLKFVQQIDVKKQIEECETFLKEYPNSIFEADVRFKLGEAQFAEKDYTTAGTQFELISTKFPDSPLLEQARFLAGQSAIRTMNPSAVDGAISLFEQVVHMKGALQTYARFEQATVKKSSAAYDEAIVLYDDLLSQTLPPDLLASTLAAKAETLYLQGSSDPKKIAVSVETFNQLATLPNVSRYWKNLALYKKGKGLEWLGKKDEMLAAYYDALALPADTNETPDYYWFYRAGFDAAESLESDEQWEAAIAIYRKLADAKGPRSGEATERIKRLRLEHFIWEK